MTKVSEFAEGAQVSTLSDEDRNFLTFMRHAPADPKGMSAAVRRGLNMLPDATFYSRASRLAESDAARDEFPDVVDKIRGLKAEREASWKDPDDDH